MRRKILKYLKENDGYVSGQELSNQLGVSRTSVWKVIKQLREQGYEIDSVSNKGYALRQSPDILTKEEVELNLNTEFIGKDVKVYESIDSTNKQAKRLAVEDATEGTVVIAEEQTEGKGRRGKSWSSPPKQGLWMTIILKPKIHPSKASMVTLLAGLSVVQAINDCSQNKAQIKWPNDTVINEKKVSGILTEMSSELDLVNYIVVGIGVNVNTQTFDDAIKDTATSLYIEEGKSYERAVIAQKILKKFEQNYILFLKEKNLKLVLDTYEKNCINLSRQVKIIHHNEVEYGKAIGISEEGHLIVLDENGTEKLLNSGEVSIRGINGYV
ncbi:BirA family biotin operon repressor/biotin-[acetyl-CoA-carboxylase] ligase [Natranaerovirga hydrolytica]|uniref:Bifunctional ligase/repressor BirA n=1 Tax=Natranaerovirga hydrolytica TaxID=680378 RepID=A0A4R1MHG3_9FIRM|nr:biotin--[acetyl-CoA-carboxylase] ligase [Natranaerovirga hydrolytica]TCK90574.1 BirA family biotin operon repressor/biotin-[acetyl-CoA-carboxylase] ligase [Natranaerovirga hydrolytica]